MNRSRRELLISAGSFACATSFAASCCSSDFRCTSGVIQNPAYSITPVISDQVWIWDQQPQDGAGATDGREFEFSVGIKWKSNGSARNVKSATVAPVAFPEQEILNFEIKKSDGCDARVVPIADGVGQFQVVAPHLDRGQEVQAHAVYRLKISRFCPNYSREQFPRQQEIDREQRQRWLGNSPGIRSDLKAVSDIVSSLTSRDDHPWDKASKFHQWVWENIEGRPGKYTSVSEALKSREGDCEERAGVFIALCRAAQIPARLVWVPNHCWAEFGLVDGAGELNWIPAHTAAYKWFGWTGAHELVLQKGDRIWLPGQNKNVRLVNDWYSFEGRRPKIEFTGQLKPVATANEDPGPGLRNKNSAGGWNLSGIHPADRRLRQN